MAIQFSSSSLFLTFPSQIPFSSSSVKKSPFLGFSLSASYSSGRSSIQTPAINRTNRTIPIRCQSKTASVHIPVDQRWMFEESKIDGPDIWNTTWYPKAADHVNTNKTWYVVNATDKILGRLASTIAIPIRGKNLATFTPSVDMGAFVIVVNGVKVAVSGKKRSQKLYRRHLGRPGGMIVETFDQLQKRIPERII